MFEGLKRRLKYYSARSRQRFEAKADPQVQLEQAIEEAQRQHRQLKEQAANLIAQQRQTELQLNRTMEELEKTNNGARQALMMANQANEQGDAAKAAEYTRAAEGFAGRLVDLEREIDGLKSLHFQAAQAADGARASVQQNATVLQQRLTERQRLMGQLEQARMQEQINAAMSSLNETVGQDVPTFDEVRGKIEARYAKASGMAELSTGGVEASMLEIERATMQAEARSRLDAMRGELGLPAADAAAGQLGTGATSNAGELGTGEEAGGSKAGATGETAESQASAAPSDESSA